MKQFHQITKPGCAGVIALLSVCLAGSGPVAADSLLESLQEVGPEYAEPYLSPLIQSWGVSQVTALYTSAAIGKSKLSWEIGLKVAGTYISEDDQSFLKYVPVTLDEGVGIQPGDPNYGREGFLELAGPTVMGDTDTDGTATLYVDGIPIRRESTISGVVNTRWVPMVIPEASIGGIAGFKGMIRFFPSIKLGDLGKLKYFGFGVQYGVNNLIPTLPIDVLVGYFRQDLDLGSFYESDASSFHLGLSKRTTMVTIYGGGALESSKTKVKYDFADPISGETVPISFEVDGVQDYRLTIGATLEMGVRINVEANAGKLAVYSAGLMLGF
jgi:hypothetical protein